MQEGSRVEIIVQPGTTPTPDDTELAALTWTETDKVYFSNGKLRNIPGWVSISTTQKIRGAARTLYSYRSAGKNYYLIGTNKRLYVVVDGRLINITPVKTSTTAIANSLATDYTTLGSDPVATTSGSSTVVFTSTAHKLQPGDSITVSGVSGTVNGIAAAALNVSFNVLSVTTNTFTVMTSGTANATGSGGGAAVIVASAVIRVTATSNGLSNGDRIKIASASTTGGIGNSEINAEHIVRNVQTNSFDIVVSTKATSSVSSGGGASTTYQKPIDSGAIDYAQGLGYGGGLYGTGLYGVAKTFINTASFPRIWAASRFGNDAVMTAGNQTGVYIWQNSTATAPTALSGAPTAVNWLFVSNSIIVTLGASGVENRIKASDVGDGTAWTVGPASYAYEDDVEGAGKFISQAASRGINLLFTQNEVYRFAFVDKPKIWETDLIMKSDGIIGPRARCEVAESVLWQGQNDFYIFDGASVSKLPDNTCRDFIYDNLNYQQAYKSFCEQDTVHNQVKFYFPLFGATECNYYLIYNYKERHFTLGRRDLTAAEENVLNPQSPYTVYSISESVDGALYQENVGVNADGQPMNSYAITNYAMIGNGNTLMEITGIIPDSTQTGTINVTIYTKEYAQSSDEATETLDSISSTTEFVDARSTGRQRKYKIELNAVDESVSWGKWFEVIQDTGEER